MLKHSIKIFMTLKTKCFNNQISNNFTAYFLYKFLEGQNNIKLNSTKFFRQHFDIDSTYFLSTTNKLYLIFLQTQIKTLALDLKQSGK